MKTKTELIPPAPQWLMRSKMRYVKHPSDGKKYAQYVAELVWGNMEIVRKELVARGEVFFTLTGAFAAARVQGFADILNKRGTPPTEFVKTRLEGEIPHFIGETFIEPPASPEVEAWRAGAK